MVARIAPDRLTERVAKLVVWVASAVYAFALSAESIYRHSRYATGFDAAIYDQRLWLLAHWHEPYSSVSDSPLLGNHIEPGIVLLTPLYWLGLGVPGLLSAQSVGLALGGPALYALARDRGASPALALAPALLWLVSPWTASVNLSDFHPEVFVPALLAVSVLSALKDRWIALAVTAVVAMSLKEDVSAVYLMLGILLVLQGRRRAGAVLASSSALWLVAARLALASQGDAVHVFGRRFAGNRGNSVSDALTWMGRHPLHAVWDMLAQSGPADFLLLLATAGLALLAPFWLLLAVPTLAHNALSDYSLQHSLAFHYHVLSAAALFVAAAVGVRRLRSFAATPRLAVAGVATAALMTTLVADLHVHDTWARRGLVSSPSIREGLALVPADVPVSATFNLQPHLSHRVELFSLPAPFGPGPLDPSARHVRFVALLNGPGHDAEGMADVLTRLRRIGFRVIYRGGPMSVLERTSGPESAS
jgi:uncharacterized membrane protein